jgi:hypothetical protein
MIQSIIFLGLILLPWNVLSFPNQHKLRQQVSFGLSAGSVNRIRHLSMAQVSITLPSPDEAASMGVRDWPQQSKKGFWTETASEGQTLVRYVLDGTGYVKIDADETSKQTTQLAPGTLIEITGEATLSWNTPGEMIILTPGFEEGGKLLGVAAALIVVCGALIAGFGF